MKLVGLSGYAKTGKDTVAGFLAEVGYQRIAFADKLKALALRIDMETGVLAGLHGGIDQAKLASPYVRQYLQDLGAGVREILGPDTWINAALDNLNFYGQYVVTDVRYPNEAARIKAMGGVVVRVDRPGTGPVNGHVSETALDGYPFDLFIENDGDLSELKEKAHRLDRGLWR